MLRPLLSVSLLLLALPSSSLACVNTSYSREEEGQITSDLTKIIAGQFPEHSEAFYDHEVVTLTAKLKKDPKDVEARNDLAAALMKLKRYGEAEAELLRIDNEHPDRYKTHANLGVLYKKTHKYAKAADHTRRALEIKPEGHLGLGDYYLRMLDWRAKVAAKDPSVKDLNFLGIAYAEGSAATAKSPLVKKEHLVTLIKADRHFAETYLILGDLLFEEGNLQNAARAYARCMANSQNSFLEEPLRENANERLGLVAREWAREAGQRKGYVFDPHYQQQIAKEFAAAGEWLANFQTVEADLLAGGTKKVDFASVQAEMKDRNLEYLVPIYREAGLYRGTKSRSGDNFGLFIIYLTGGAVVLSGAIIFLLRRFKKPTVNLQSDGSASLS
jgi:tetratricopeptide (TPR) repeat protein